MTEREYAEYLLAIENGDFTDYETIEDTLLTDAIADCLLPSWDDVTN